MAFLDILKRLTQQKGVMGQSIVIVDNDQALWAPRDYESFAREGYESNPYVFAAISEIARSISGLPWRVMEKQADGGSFVTTDITNPVVSMFERPNPQQSGSTFLEAAISYYMISGNCYIHAVGPDSGAPTELWLLRPDRMKVIPGNAEGFVSAYEYSVNEKKHRLGYESILHIRSFSPRNNFYGMSPIEAAARSIDSNNESRKWNYNLLKNNAKVTFALTTEGELTDQQRQRIKQEFTDKYSGSENAGKPKVFEGGIKPHVLSQSPEQMDWTEGIRLSGKEIAIAMGVPPEIIGDSQNRSYASYSEARKSFYMETVLPIAEVFTQELNMWLMPRIDDRFYLQVNRDNIDALQEDRSEVWSRTMDAVGAGVLTTNEARDLLGYEAVDGGDSLEMATPMQAPMPKSKNATPATKTVRRCTSDEQDPDKPSADQVWCVLTEDESRVLGRHATRMEAEEQLYLIDRQKDDVSPVEEVKINAWKEIERQRERAYIATEKIFAKRLKDEIKTIASVLEQATAEEELVVLLDIAAREQEEEWFKTLSGVYLGVGEGFANEVYDGLKSAPGPKQIKAPEEVIAAWERKIIEYLTLSMPHKFKDLSHTTRDMIQATINSYIDGGMSWRDVAEAISKNLPNTPGVKARSALIARTETLTAASSSSHFAAEATGLPLTKSWFGTPDDRARSWHRRGIEPAPLKDAYQVKRPSKSGFSGYDRLQFPGDWSLGAGAANICNCRCVEFYNKIGSEE